MTITTNELEAFNSKLTDENVYVRLGAVDDAAWLCSDILEALVLPLVNASILDKNADVRNQAANALTRIIRLGEHLNDEIYKMREQVKIQLDLNENEGDTF